MAEPRAQDDWTSPAFREKIVKSLEEEIKNKGAQSSKTSVEWEQAIFNKATSMQEYRDLVSKVVKNFSSSAERNRNHAVNQAMAQQAVQNPGVQDPINALNNLSQNSANMLRQTQGIVQRMPQRPHLVDHLQRQHPPMMNHPRGQMTQQPPQLTRQDAFMVTTPQSIPSVVSQTLPASTATMVFQNQGGVRPNTISMPQPPTMTGREALMPRASPVQPSPLNIIPSPYGMTVSPAVRQQTGVPSPSATLHTPGTAVSDPSPGPPSTSSEEKAYVEKLNKLSKYIEPLQKSLQEFEKKADDNSLRQRNKAKNLLDVLTNPGKRVPMAVLDKCEQTLVKLVSLMTNNPNAHMCQTLLDAVAHCSMAPNLNHSLYRTFGPALEAYMGSPIKAPSPPLKKRIKLDKEQPDELPDFLQGEIARLGRRFHISVDNRHHARSEAHHLMCRLDEELLPSVPPLLVTIPKTYPQTSPYCDPNNCPGYDATEFFTNVQNNLSTHLSRMPNRFCLTQLLRSWELSVRKACDPENPVLTGDGLSVKLSV